MYICAPKTKNNHKLGKFEVSIYKNSNFSTKKSNKLQIKIVVYIVCTKEEVCNILFLLLVSRL